MSKISIENEVLLEIYCNKLFGSDIESAAEIISKDLEMSQKKVESVIYDLKKKNAVLIKDGVLTESYKKTHELEKRDLLPKEKEQKPQELDDDYNNYKSKEIKVGDVVLCTILKDKKGLLYAKPHRNEFDECIVLKSPLAEQAIGKTCLLKLTDIRHGYTGVIEQVFGAVDDPIEENIAIATKYGFTNKFPESALNEARQIPQEVTLEQKKGRTDLRHLDFVTIDPEGCKDKDDAIYDEQLEDGSFRTYIAIADVTSAIKVGSALDKEAFKRGNSAYLGGGVYPMFPPELSNGIFSLDEDKERLAFVVSAVIKDNKKIVDPKVELAVIKVKKGYSYPEAEKTHDSVDGFEKINETTKEQLDLLYKNTPIIEKRFSTMLKPDSHEPEYRFSDDKKSVEDVKLSNSEYSHIVVEARMLLANEIVAQYFMRQNELGLFRTHEKSMDSKIAELQMKLAKYGINHKLEDTTRSYFKLLEEVRKSPARDYLMFEIIRSMSKAKYKATVDETEHFGLGVSGDRGYMHFTSPIRRYADLETHRLLKQILLMGKTNVDEDLLGEIAEHLNVQEKKADDAEKESDAYLACLWAEKHTKEVQEGIIVKLTPLTAEILHTNGTTRITMPLYELKNGKEDPYKVAEDGMKAYNQTSEYKLGDKVQFKFDKINLASRMIFGTTSLEKKFEENKDNSKVM